ncbi:MAG TPA: glycosyltransferase [Candidatus Eisenbacteria bacterium]
MPGPRFIDSVVGLIALQSIAFVLTWTAAFSLGARLRRGHWLASLAFLALVEAAALFAVRALGGAPPPAAGWIAVAAVGVLAVALADDWNAIGQAALAATLSVSALFLVYIGVVTTTSHLGPISLAFSLVLYALQAFALLLLVASTCEILDVVCRIRWRRIWRPSPIERDFPRVSIHVPAYNEPPEMVKETLDALARLDYPNYEVIVIDDNTTDERLWRPVEAHCRALGFRFYHLENWPGFKSGALNFALQETDPAVEVVGIVDSDYLVSPDWLRLCVGFFRDPSVGFVQTPQDYRDVAFDDRYAIACYDAYRYFFKISMASRNEHDGIIFAGTMGLVRRCVLEEAGGWDEWCITEDAELSIRILERGYHGCYVDRSFGRGLMPFNFEGLKKQRFRWAFGGMQILRLHWKSLLLGARSEGRRLTWAQRWDYLLGGLQWLNDPVTFGFTALLLLGTVSLLVAHSLFIQPLAGAVLLVPILFVFIGVSRFLWALRVRLGCSLRRAASAFTILLALTWVVTLACALGLTKERGVFLRTPKKRAASGRRHAFRIVTEETTLSAFCFAAALALGARLPYAPYVWLMVGLLVWQGVIYSSALRASLWSVASEARVLHPEYLGASRTTGRRFSSMVSDRRVVRGVLAAVAAAFALFLLAVLFAPEEERMYRARPEAVPIVGGELTRPEPEAHIRALLYLEGRAALSGDVEAATRLWSADGVIRDANYTPDDPSDDRVWTGIEAIRQRYRAEFGQRRYLKLAHSDASVIIEGNRATVVNDLHAEILTLTGLQTVFLSRSDRWTFRKEKDGWRILELVVNRARR